MSELLYARTQGNPLFVQQTLALLAQRGAPLDESSLLRLSLPDAVRSVLRQRIAALDPGTQRVLRMAAVQGVTLHSEHLGEALALPLTEVLAALEPAHRCGVVVDAGPGSAHAFRFHHPLLREAIYDDLTLAERGDHHARLGRALERSAGAGDARALCELARHFLAGVPSDLDACIRHARAAADAARASLGFGTAADLLTQACEKLAREAGDPRLRCELLLLLGLDCFCIGDVPRAWQALRQGALLSEQIGATEPLARCAYGLALWLELGGGDELQTRRLIARALRAVGAHASDERALLLASQAVLRYELSCDARRALLDEAAASAAAHNHPDISLQLVLCRLSVRDPTCLEDSRQAIVDYRALVRDGAHGELPYPILHELALDITDYLCALTLGDLDAADAVIARCRRNAEHAQIAAASLAVELMSAGRALGDGRFDDLAETIQRASEASTITTGGFNMVWHVYAIAWKAG